MVEVPQVKTNLPLVAHPSQADPVSDSEIDSIVQFLVDVVTKNLSSLTDLVPEFLNICVDSKYAKLFVLAFNSLPKEKRPRGFNVVLDSLLASAIPSVSGISEEFREAEVRVELKEQINASPVKSEAIQSTLKIPKSSIVPRLTSHPRLAVKMLNEYPELEYIVVKNEQPGKKILERAISVLITETLTGTNVKRSHLEIPEYKQVYTIETCAALGCPEMPTALNSSRSGFDKFLINGFDQLRNVAQILFTEPVFGDKMTKRGVMSALKSSSVLFLSTHSSNESNSRLVCSESREEPSSSVQTNDLCLLSSDDLNMVDAFKCKLVVLNCYSTIHHRPRFRFAKKLLLRGCRNVLLVLSPLTHKLMTQFFTHFLQSLYRYFNFFF